MEDIKEGSLRSSAMSALKWNYLGTITKFIIQFGIQVVLARLLGPAPFGQIAVVWVIVGLVTLVADAGYGPALVQRKNLTEADVRYGFTMQTAVGVGLSLALTVAAGGIASLWNDPALTPIIRITSLILVFQSAAQTSTSLLKRQLAFKEIQVAQIVSYVMAFCLLGVPGAIIGYGVWSLVASQVTQSLIYAVLVYARVRHSILPQFRNGSSGLTSYGAKVMGTNLLNWVIGSADQFTISRFFGSSVLGLYNRSYNLVSLLSTNVVGVIQQVLFPTYSRLQDQRHQTALVHVASINVTMAVMLPVFGGIAMVSDVIIETVYGPDWLAAASLLRPLALAMPFQIVVALTGPLVWGAGRVELEAAVQGGVAVMMAVFMWLLRGTSVDAVAWCVFAVSVVRAVCMSAVAGRVIGASWSALVSAYRGGALGLAVVTGLIGLVDAALSGAGVVTGLRFLLATLVGTLGLFSCLWYRSSWVLAPPVRSWLREHSGNVPDWVRPAIKRLAA